MPSYDFFFSYPQAELENNGYLLRFYDYLRKKVKSLGGEAPDGAFLDQDTIERGAEWSQALRDGLQNSKALVAVYCPSYFISKSCLKEIRVFLERQKALAMADPRRPRIIMPILWEVAPNHEIPPDLAELQYDKGIRAFFKDKGLGSYLQISGVTRKYKEFVDELARDIVATSKLTLPPIQNFPSFDDDDPIPATAISNDKGGPNHVRFVYIAPTEHLSMGERRNYYGSESRSWKPFLPKFNGGIGALAQRIAGRYNFTSDELTFDDALPSRIQDAEARRNIVVILIDGWAVTMRDYATVINELDSMRIPSYGGVIVPWASDLVTSQEKNHLTAEVRRALKNWVADSNPARFDDTITSVSQFRKQLLVTLTRLKNAVLMTPEADGPVLPGPAKATVSTKG